MLCTPYFRNRVRGQPGRRRGCKRRYHEHRGHGGDGRQHGDSGHGRDARDWRKHPTFRWLDQRGRHVQRRKCNDERRFHRHRRLESNGGRVRRNHGNGRQHDVRRNHGNRRQHGQRWSGGRHGHWGTNGWHHGRGWIYCHRWDHGHRWHHCLLTQLLILRFPDRQRHQRRRDRRNPMEHAGKGQGLHQNQQPQQDRDRRYCRLPTRWHISPGHDVYAYQR